MVIKRIILRRPMLSMPNFTEIWAARVRTGLGKGKGRHTLTGKQKTPGDKTSFKLVKRQYLYTAN